MIGSRRPLCETYDVALLDLDGVVYVGEHAVDGVPEALALARSHGMRLAFVTNNASRTPGQVADLLTRVGVPASPIEVITSSHAVSHEIADELPAGSKVLVLGAIGLIEAIRERGLVPVFNADDDPRAVVQGYSPDLDWRALAEGAVAINRGVPWFASNLDATVPSPRGPLPGNGSMVAVLRNATGAEPRSTGKPDPRMHAESVQRSHAKNPVVVGDRLDTDIEGARRVGCASLLVLSGVTGIDRLLDADPAHRPDYLGHDVSALLIRHPKVSTDGDTTTAGGVRVTVKEDAITVEGHDTTGDGLDETRALAVACWRLADEGRPRPDVRREG